MRKDPVGPDGLPLPELKPGELRDPLTLHTCQLWQQYRLGGQPPLYRSVYLYQGKWRAGSPQLTDRLLRSCGLQPLQEPPWGAGREIAEQFNAVAGNLGEQAESIGAVVSGPAEGE